MTQLQTDFPLASLDALGASNQSLYRRGFGPVWPRSLHRGARRYRSRRRPLSRQRLRPGPAPRPAGARAGRATATSARWPASSPISSTRIFALSRSPEMETDHPQRSNSPGRAVPRGRSDVPPPARPAAVRRGPGPCWRGKGRRPQRRRAGRRRAAGGRRGRTRRPPSAARAHVPVGKPAEAVTAQQAHDATRDAELRQRIERSPPVFTPAPRSRDRNAFTWRKPRARSTTCRCCGSAERDGASDSVVAHVVMIRARPFRRSAPVACMKRSTFAGATPCANRRSEAQKMKIDAAMPAI